MVKFFLGVVFFTLFLNASNLQVKIESFLGKNEYIIQKNLIDVLFKNEDRFLKSNGKVDDIAVLKELKDNGLLKLFYNSPQNLNLTFITKEGSFIVLKVINETLSLMGYNYFLTNKVVRNEDGFLWQISISTEHIVDPVIFASRLHSRGCFFEEIRRDSPIEWTYRINSENINIETIHMELDSTTQLKKPIRPYWIDVYGAKNIIINSKRADRWHPSIVFFDEKLNMVKSYKQESVVKRLKLEVPLNSKYVKISDFYTLDNIKRGLSIKIQ